MKEIVSFLFRIQNEILRCYDLKFQIGCNKAVIELRVVQFCSEIMLVISNRTLDAHPSDFKITRMISDQIHSTYTFTLIAGFHCHAIKNKNKTINSRI